MQTKHHSNSPYYPQNIGNVLTISQQFSCIVNDHQNKNNQTYNFVD